MKILSVVQKSYWGVPGYIEPMYLQFTDPLQDLGHKVEHFDHYEMNKKHGSEGCGERFVQQVKTQRYDVVFYQTSCPNAMPAEAIKSAGEESPIVGWNTDDDWQWETYTRNLAPYFTFMVTTYPHIYEANVAEYPNLKLSQWGCYDRFADFNCQKDLGFTFAGQIYGERLKECQFLQKQAGLQVFGPASGFVKFNFLNFPGLRKVARKIPALYGKTLHFKEINAIWNRSKISYTSMGASVNSNILQIKSRTFEMGLSGTLMLCQHSPNLERYYEPNKEFIPFYDLQDCVEKARYYLKHESERFRIAEAYHARTKAEHLWQHRFKQLFRDIGLD